MQIEVREPTLDELIDLSNRLCDEDECEIRAMGLNPQLGIISTASESVEIQAAFKGGLILSAWGVAITQDLAGIARPWMVMTPEGRKHPRTIMQISHAAVASWSRKYGYLENFVDSRHRQAVRWLKRIGFSVEPALPMGPYGREFHRFHRELQHVP